MDKNGSVLEINRAAELLFGYTHDAMMNVNLGSLMPERYRADHLNGIKRVITTGKSTYLNRLFEFHGLTKEGKEFPMELNVATWYVGDTQFFSGIIRDISSRKMSEAALRDSEEKLRIIFNSTNENSPRDLAIYLVRNLCRMTLLNVGQEFGIANYSSVSSVVQRVKLRLETDKHLKKKKNGTN